jgi:hypothetical protein
MNDLFSPYLIALGLIVISTLYGYWLGNKDGYQKGLDDGFNNYFNSERR